MGVPPNHPRLDFFDIKTYGFGGTPILRNLHLNPFLSGASLNRPSRALEVDVRSSAPPPPEHSAALPSAGPSASFLRGSFAGTTWGHGRRPENGKCGENPSSLDVIGGTMWN